ncbi:MAG: hypothetical protein A2X36_01835 [Elusimicrobia bacterium GWA2_69_24]|nr:MAG: hypothetical protein A2X36_01835 [Elusimicrobia bacterium GWA2_69_24]HBL16884.1 hypothetical protein [Elusimicrobiota bacterium]
MINRALVVDDDESVALLMARCLERLGWTADVAHAKESALALFQSGGHGLVICDINLGRADGISVARRIREMAPAVRIVMSSALPDNLERARAEGFLLCLGKPFRPEQFQAVIECGQ